MTYTVKIELDQKMGTEVQKHSRKVDTWARKWQSLNPEGMEFSFTDREININIDIPD